MGITIKKNDAAAPATKLQQAAKPVAKAPAPIGAEPDIGLTTKASTVIKAPTKPLVKPGSKPAPAPVAVQEDVLPEELPEDVLPEDAEENLPQSDDTEYGTQNIVGTTETIHADGSMESTSEDLGSVQVPAAFAKVRVDIGLTKNLGNYESLKINVGIEIPCAVDADEIESTYAQAKAWVDDKINDINAEVSAAAD